MLSALRLVHWRFNPRGPCGPRQLVCGVGDAGRGISILAVLADRNPPDHGPVRHEADISILAVLADRDKGSATGWHTAQRFQSLRSLRTATEKTALHDPGRAPISILAVLADRDRILLVPKDINKRISILAVLADRDSYLTLLIIIDLTFQSSRSLRTATNPSRGHRRTTVHFNPRGPCGPRHVSGCRCWVCVKFQSSRSLRTAT